jgi:sugar phosphate isomerase/epimerase
MRSTSERVHGLTEAGWDPRLCVNSLSSLTWTLHEDLACYERLGIDRMSAFLPKLVKVGLDQAVSEITGRGLRVDGILPGNSFDLSDQSTWSCTRDAMVMGIEVAQRLGATTLQTPGGSARGQPYERAVEQLGLALAPVTDAASKAGIRLALEPTRPQFAHISFVHTIRDALALAMDLGVWLVPDSAHSWWEPDVESVLARVVPHIAVLQLADLDFRAPVFERLVPGDGEIRLDALIGATVDAGFDGPFELEILGSAIEAEGYESAIRRSFTHLTSLLAVPI